MALDNFGLATLDPSCAINNPSVVQMDQTARQCQSCRGNILHLNVFQNGVFWHPWEKAFALLYKPSSRLL